MKKYLFTVTIALTMGAVFALYIFESNESQAITALSNSGKVYYFQLAMFENEENANNYIDEIGFGEIVNEEGNYRVYSALYSNEYLKSQLESYYMINNINYMIKEDYLSGSDYEELLSYENVLVQTDNMEVILRTNNLILENIVSTN